MPNLRFEQVCFGAFDVETNDGARYRVNVPADPALAHTLLGYRLRKDGQPYARAACRMIRSAECVVILSADMLVGG